MGISDLEEIFKAFMDREGVSEAAVFGVPSATLLFIKDMAMRHCR